MPLTAASWTGESPAFKGRYSQMTYEVSLTKDAEPDLEDIYFYIAEPDSPCWQPPGRNDGCVI